MLGSADSDSQVRPGFPTPSPETQVLLERDPRRPVPSSCPRLALEQAIESRGTPRRVPADEPLSVAVVVKVRCAEHNKVFAWRDFLP